MPKRKLVVEDLLKLSFVSEVQIHPDGSRAVACVKTVKSPGAYRSRLVELKAGEEPKEITHGDFMDTSPRWSPDGSQLLFQSNRNKPNPGLYLLSTSMGEPKLVVDLPEGSIGDFQWSPDGKTIAFLFRKKADDCTTKAEEQRKKDESSTPPFEITTWPYKLDGDGLFNNDLHEIFILDIENGSYKKIFGGQDIRDICFTWAPDGKRLAVAAQVGKDSFKKPTDKDLFIIDIQTRQKTKLAKTNGSIERLDWSPSGKWIAAIADDRTTDPWGPKAEHILLIDPKTNRQKTLLKNEDIFLGAHALGDTRDPAETKLFWAPDEKSIYFQLGEKGTQTIAQVTLDDELIRLQTNAKGEVHLWSASRDRKHFGTTITTGNKPAEAALLTVTRNTANITPLTNLNHEFTSTIDLATPQEISVRSKDGTKIQSWVLRHPSKTKQRAAIEVHGGPMAMYSTGFFFEMQLLAANGFAVFFSNPRGSTGYGEAFCRAIKGKWGELDWQDVQALTDYAAKQTYVDAKKICILGGSYGGFMVNWAIGHTNAYYRAVTDRCVSNLISKWGNSDYMFIPNGNWPGSVFGNSEQLWNCSPIKYFGKVKTPTLIIHSEGDLRCPIEQGEQVFAALKLLGVETKFIRYPPSTSHGMSRGGPPDLRVHRLKAIVEWLKR